MRSSGNSILDDSKKKKAADSSAAFRQNNGTALFRGSLVNVPDFRPVYHIPECLEVIRTTVLIFEVVGVFPNVAPEDRFVTFHNRTVLIGSGSHFQFALFVTINQAQPLPNR